MTTVDSAWETAEIERSDYEAQHTPDQSLYASESNVRRYLNPPADTPYPLEYAFALLGDVAGQRVLDFGCGSGENTLVLARRNARVVGVDISESLLSLAQRRLTLNGLGGTAEFFVGSAHALPFPDESIDVVFGIAILHHLDLESASREVHRVLKPGGRGIFQEPVRDSAVLRFIRRCIPYRAPDVSPYERPLTSAELWQFGGRFSRFTSRAFSLPHVNLIQVLPVWRELIHVAYPLDRTILKAVPALSHFAGVRVVEVIK